MKTFKRTLSFLLCCVLLAAFAPMVHAENIMIEKAEAAFAVPASGEPFDFNAVTVPPGAHYTATARVYYWKDKATVTLTAEDAVEKGVRYYVRVTFAADSGYMLSNDKTEYAVNGKVITGRVGTSTVETSFVAGDKVPGKPDDPTPAPLTFWQRVVQFFRNIPIWFASFFRRIRSLPGLT